MSLVAWYAVLAAVQGALALWVILAQPRRLLNWAIGTFLILWAGSGIAYQLMKEATSPESFQMFRRVGDIYEAPTFLLILLAIDRLLIGSPKPRGWKGLIVMSCAALVVFLAAHALAAPADNSLALRVANTSAKLLAQTAAVLLACRAANDARRSALQRRRAALFGLAFALLLAHDGPGSISHLLRGAMLSDITLVYDPLVFIGLCTALYAAVRLPAPFHAGARAAVAGSIFLALLIGTMNHVRVATLTIPAGRAVVLSAFSLVLGVAVLRYDLGAARAEERRRLQSVATLLLGLCAAAIIGVAAWSLSGQGAVTIGVALAALVAPVALLVTPLKRLPAWMTRRVLLQSRDPEALRERVRVYASTLRAATGPDGLPVGAAEPALVALRTQLGLGQRDHDLLVAMGGDQSAGGIVAYRLALVSAAADSETLDEAQLARLREELNVTERDHALVLEHVQASADSLSAGALFLGHYHVVRRLGEGGLGEVWLAHDTRAGLDVVLKRLTGNDRRDAAALQRIRREVRATSTLGHPRIVAVRDVETVGDETYLVMEFMSGGSLADVLRRRGPLPEADVIRIATDVLEALAAVHARGMVHRDVKPANILLDEKGAAKLGDFNIARELVSGDTLGQEGVRGPVGTFAYMPPEQARGRAARPQSDLYGLAATMYEALAGAPLLDVVGLSHTEAVARITQLAPPVAVPHASARLSAVIARALARLPEDRFADATEMSAAITPVGTREGCDPPPPRPPA